jgi:hypothetical protein
MKNAAAVHTQLDTLGAKIATRKTAVDIGGARRKEPAGGPNTLRKPLRRNHNAGGKSSWMQGFFIQPGPPLWQALSGEHRGRRFSRRWPAWLTRLQTPGSVESI